MVKLTLLIFFLVSCTSIKRPSPKLYPVTTYPSHIIKSEQLRISQFSQRELINEGDMTTEIELEGENSSFTIYLYPQDDYFLKEILVHIKSDYDLLYLTYFTKGEKKCLNSIRFDNNELSYNLFTQRCTQFIGAYSKGMLNNQVNVNNSHSPNFSKINIFLEKNPQYQNFKSAAINKSIQVGMPLELAELMVGKTEIAGIYNGNERRKVKGWSIFVRDSKVVSFMREQYNK